MEFNEDKLIQEYKDYKIKHNLIITDKQIKYINHLYDLIDKKKLSLLESEELIERLGGIKNIKNNKLLEDNEIFGIIQILKKYAPISFHQLLAIRNIYTEDDIKRILKIKETDEIKSSVSETSKISMKDAELLLGGPDKFKPWIKEHPIICEEEWEYGWQESELCENGRLEYLKFYNMMMIDIDNQSEKEMISLLKKFKTMRFRIYKTFNGYHVFIVSTMINYGDLKVMEITRILKGDLFYVMFAAKTGFKVRLTKKLNRNEEKICQYLYDIGTCQYNETCKKLINVHDKYNKIS